MHTARWTHVAALGLIIGAAQAQDTVVTQFASTVTVGYSTVSSIAQANNVISLSSIPTTLSTVTSTSSSSAASQTTNVYNGGDDGTPGAVDNNGGAAGGDTSSFNLSQGGLIAIIVVCAFVVILGVASTILYVMAKRRQWDVRGSIARASRRMTGRFGAGKQTAAKSSRRQGMHSRGLPMTETRSGHKRGLVVDVKPVGSHKGPLRGKAPENTRPREQTWVKGLWGGGWK